MRSWRERVSGQISSSFPYGGLRHWSPGVRLLSYQLEPALAIFRHGASRLLLGDDVGVGKTVEAGIVLKEVVGRDSSARVLVVVPSALKDQWIEELTRLFAVEVTDASSGWLRSAARRVPPDVNPWSLPGVYLASVDFVKRTEALEALLGARWDLLIADEAHGAGPGTDRYSALDALARRSSVVLLLSATPHSGDAGQFTALCNLGRTDGEPPIVCFRRTRSDVAPDGVRPRRRVLQVRPSDAERRMHRLLEAYTRELLATTGGRIEGHAGLLATLLKKRALSSPSSLVRSLARREAALAGRDPMPPLQPRLPLGEEEEACKDDEPGGVLTGAAIGDGERERWMLGEVLREARAAAALERKPRVLLRLLHRLREAAIVFSEYRDTAAALEQLLSASGLSVVVLHGGMNGEERRAAARAFSAGGSILVATDAASEGLNLHHCCRLVVHFELPWSPARMHQRCGRVDRIGQSRRVHEIALVSRDTAEDLVLRPLLRRASSSAAFGGGLMPEIAVRMLIGEDGEAPAALHASDSPGQDLFTVGDLAEEAAVETERLALCLRLPSASLDGDAAGRQACVPIARSARGDCSDPAQLILIVALTWREGGGEIIERALHPLALSIDHVRWARGRAAVRRQVEAVLQSSRSRIEATVRGIAEARRTPLLRLRAGRREPERERSRAVARTFAGSRPQLVQADLFARRAARVDVWLEDVRDTREGRSEGPVCGPPEWEWSVEAVLCGGLA